jgi:hypothetical protein
MPLPHFRNQPSGNNSPTHIDPNEGEWKFTFKGEEYKFSKYGVLSKWGPVLKTYLPLVVNKSTLIAIGCYAEWFTIVQEYKNIYASCASILDPLSTTSTITGSNLPDEINEINEKIRKFERIEILGKYFNPSSGIVEYKLANGEYIPVDKEIEYKLSVDEMISIFGFDFVHDYVPTSLLRDYK